MLRFCSPCVIFVSCLIFFGTVLSPTSGEGELEFIEKYTDSTTYTRWEALDNIDESQLKLICVRSFKTTNNAAQCSVQAIRHYNQTMQHYSFIHKRHRTIRLDLLECHLKFQFSSEKNPGKFYLAEGKEIGQLFKLVEAVSTLLFVGIVEVSLTQYERQNQPSSTSSQYHSNALDNVQESFTPVIIIDPHSPTLLQAGESSHHGVNEQENSSSHCYLNTWADTDREPQPPDVSNEPLPHPPLQSIQELSQIQWEDEEYLTDSTSLVNQMDFQKLNQNEFPQYRISNIDTAFPENLFPPVPTDTFQTPPLQSVSHAKFEEPYKTNSPEKKRKHHTMNEIISGLKDISSKRATRIKNISNSSREPIGDLLSSIISQTPIEILQTQVEEPHAIRDIVTPETQQSHQTLDQVSFAPQHIFQEHAPYEYVQNTLISPHELIPPTVTADSQFSVPPSLTESSLSQVVLQRDANALDQISSQLQNVSSRHNPQNFPNLSRQTFLPNVTSNLPPTKQFKQIESQNSQPSSMVQTEPSQVKPQEPNERDSTGDAVELYHLEQAYPDLSQPFPSGQEIPSSQSLETSSSVHHPNKSDKYKTNFYGHKNEK